jgi:hypothetical protein
MTTSYGQPIISISNPSQAEAKQVSASGFAVGSSEYPPLSEDDIQLAGVQGQLSVIPESREAESLTVTESEMDSGDEAIFRFIQDQFAGGQEASGSSQTPASLPFRPSLQPYSEPPALQPYTNPADATPQSANGASVGVPNWRLLSIQSSLRSGLTQHLSGEPGSLPIPQRTETTSMGAHVAESSGQTGQRHVSPLAVKSADTPDHTVVPTAQNERSFNTHTPPAVDLQPTPAHILSPRTSDEDRISSGDMFGSGPSGSRKDFLEASQYRESQVRESEKQPGPTSTGVAALSKPSGMATMSPGPSRRNPNLRLKMDGFGSSSPASTVSNPQGVGTDDVDRSGMPQSASSSRSSRTTLSSSAQDDAAAFLLNTGISPLTATPWTPGSKSTEGSSPKSRHESGSSISTPKSSTFDKQEHEWGQCMVFCIYDLLSYLSFLSCCVCVFFLWFFVVFFLVFL